MYSQISANKRKTVLMMILFVILVGALGWFFSKYFLEQPAITPFILIGAAIYTLFSYFTGSRLALAINGATRIEKKDNPRLWRTVENLAITNGMPMPKVYVIDDTALTPSPLTITIVKTK